MSDPEYINRLRISMRGAINLVRRRQAEKDRPARVNLTVDQLMLVLEIQDYRCAIARQPFYTCDNSYGPTIPTIDRINPYGDYELGNVRIVMLGVTGLKGCGTDAEMYALIEAVSANRANASALKRRLTQMEAGYT